MAKKTWEQLGDGKTWETITAVWELFETFWDIFENH